jgi:hypothetical protein
MKTSIYSVVMVIVALFAMATSANAQSVSGIIGQAKKQHIDCDHVAVVDGYLHDTPCGGWSAGLRGGYMHMECENEYGNFTTGGAIYGAEVNYRAILGRQIAVKPTVYGLASSKMTFEGQDVRSFEFGAELPFEFFIHHNVGGVDYPNKMWLSIGPKIAYHNTKSIKELDTEAYLLTIPAQSNVWMWGGVAALNFQLGTVKTIKKVQAGGRLYKVTKHHPIRLSIGASYLRGTFHKPAEGKMEMQGWSGFASITYQL